MSGHPQVTELWKALTPEQKKDLAARVGTSYRALHQVIHSHRRASPERAIELADQLNAMGKRDKSAAGPMMRSATRGWFRPDLWS